MSSLVILLLVAALYALFLKWQNGGYCRMPLAEELKFRNELDANFAEIRRWAKDLEKVENLNADV